MATFRVREYTRDIKGAPGHEGFKGYWVYCSNTYHIDYYEAVKEAIAIEKGNGIPNWVDCLETEHLYNERVYGNNRN